MGGREGKEKDVQGAECIALNANRHRVSAQIQNPAPSFSYPPWAL